MEAITELLGYLADKFPLLSFILTLLAILVVLCSAVTKAFPAVDKTGKLAGIIQLCDFLSVFYPKWKTVTQSPTEAEKDDQTA